MDPNTQMVPADEGRQQVAPAGVEQSTGFGTEMVKRGAETAGLAVAAQARAMVEARCVMALQRPRSFDVVRSRLMVEAKRPGFARVAKYSKPMGNKPIVGPSIRFAEAALRCMSNVTAETFVVYSDDEKTIVRVVVGDLETNVQMSKDVVVERRVERSRTSPGQKVYGQRVNSYGKPVYLVQATDDEMLAKEGSLVSKALRTLVLRLLPGDILDDVMAEVDRTAANETAKDPGAERKRLIDAFADVAVRADELTEYVGHSLESLAPAELKDLRGLWVAIRDGVVTWHEVLAERKAERSAPAAPPSSDASQPQPADAKPSKATGAKAQAKAALDQVKRGAKPAALPADACQGCAGTGGVERDGKPLCACPDCEGTGKKKAAPPAPAEAPPAEREPGSDDE